MGFTLMVLLQNLLTSFHPTDRKFSRLFLEMNSHSAFKDIVWFLFLVKVSISIQQNMGVWKQSLMSMRKHWNSKIFDKKVLRKF